MSAISTTSFGARDPAHPMLEVDLFVEHPIPFGELWRRSEVVSLETAEVRVASIPDLIALKKLAARPQDLIDIEELESIHDARRKR